MAAYPGAVRTFTTKKDKTDVNYAADVNALQDEITAIEKALGVNPQGASLTANARMIAIETVLAKQKWGATALTFNSGGEATLTHGLGQVPVAIVVSPGLLHPPSQGVLVGARTGSATSTAVVIDGRIGFTTSDPYVGTILVHWFVGA